MEMNTLPQAAAASTLAELLKLWARRWLWLVGGAVIALALAAAVLSVLPDEWEGSQLIELGVVGKQDSGQPLLVEPPSHSVERVKRLPFKEDVWKASGQNVESAERRLFEQSLRARVVGSGFVDVKVRAFSPQQVEKLLAAVVARLHQVHQEMSAGTISNLEKAIGETDRAIKVLETARGASMADRSRAGTIDPRLFSQSVLRSIELRSLDSDLIALRQKRLDFEEQLVRIRNQPTQAVDRVDLEPAPVFPRKILTLALALLAGLSVAAFALVVRERLRAPTG